MSYTRRSGRSRGHSGRRKEIKEPRAQKGIKKHFQIAKASLQKTKNTLSKELERRDVSLSKVEAECRKDLLGSCQALIVKIEAFATDVAVIIENDMSKDIKSQLDSVFKDIKQLNSLSPFNLLAQLEEVSLRIMEVGGTIGAVKQPGIEAQTVMERAAETLKNFGASTEILLRKGRAQNKKLNINIRNLKEVLHKTFKSKGLKLNMVIDLFEDKGWLGNISAIMDDVKNAKTKGKLKALLKKYGMMDNKKEFDKLFSQSNAEHIKDFVLAAVACVSFAMIMLMLFFLVEAKKNSRNRWSPRRDRSQEVWYPYGN